MISVLNRYLHGYVVVPVILSFIKKDFFSSKWLDYTIDDLAKIYSFNRGNFKTSLSVFESLGWVERSNNGKYCSSDSMPHPDIFNLSIERFFKIPLNEILNEKKFTLEETINSFQVKDWDTIVETIPDDNTMVSDFLKSPIIIPLLYVLKRREFLLTSNLDVTQLSINTKDFLIKVLRKADLGELENNSFKLNEKGSYLVNNIEKSGVVLSYYRLLQDMDKILFGNAEEVFQDNAEEIHIDRTLNVIGSGEQHNIFFNDFVQVALKLISSDEGADSLIIVDTGCGDGSLLKKIHESVANTDKSISFIGVDFNESALVEAKNQLKDIPHDLIWGNIAEPEEILEQLRVKRFEKNEMLHIRTFLDHNCPLIIEKNEQEEEPNSEEESIGIFTNESGEELNNNDILRHYQTLFKRWRGVISEKGLITLEVYSLGTKTIKKYLEETESLHFDTIHSLSQQYLLSASNYIICAASAGLIPELSTFKKYPRILPYTRISLQHFLPKEYTINHPNEKDLQRLIEVEKLTVPSELRATNNQIKLRIINNPKGVYLMSKNEDLIGILYSQLISKESELYEMKYDNVESFHSSDGKVAQMISLHILPKYQSQGYSRELLSFGILHNFLKHSIRKIVGISRCASYNEKKGNYSDYILEKNRMGLLKDPILNFHFEEGAKIISAVKNYRPKDLDNFGNGVHIRYSFGDWLSKKQQV